MKKKRLALIPLLVLLFAGALLAGCNKEPEADFKNETPQQQQKRQEKKGD